MDAEAQREDVADDSDDELDPYEFTNLINEYTSVIKREKGKVKVLESLPTPICLASIMTCSKSTMSHLYLLSKLKRATKSLNKSIGS